MSCARLLRYEPAAVDGESNGCQLMPCAWLLEARNMSMLVRFLFGRNGMATQVAPCAFLRSRHSLFTLLTACALLFVAAPARAADPAIEFMKQTARELIADARTGSQRDFIEVVQNRGHIPAIEIGREHV